MTFVDLEDLHGASYTSFIDREKHHDCHCAAESVDARGLSRP